MYDNDGDECSGNGGGGGGGGGDDVDEGYNHLYRFRAV